MRGPIPDKPANRPTAPEVGALIRALHNTPEGGCGCCLHIVTDDGNLAECHIKYCLDYARERGHTHCMKIAEMLLAMTTTQRRKATRLY